MKDAMRELLCCLEDRVFPVGSLTQSASLLTETGCRCGTWGVGWQSGGARKQNVKYIRL